MEVSIENEVNVIDYFSYFVSVKVAAHSLPLITMIVPRIDKTDKKKQGRSYVTKFQLVF